MGATNKTRCASLATVILGCCAATTDRDEAERRPGGPRFIAACDFEGTQPGMGFTRYVFGEPTEQMAEARIGTLGCTRQHIEPYSSDRIGGALEPMGEGEAIPPAIEQIGRGSCRERVCQYV